MNEVHLHTIASFLISRVGKMELEILGVPQAVCFDPHIQILGHWDNPVSWNQRPEKNQACRV